jgi:S-DNA-T family DNA segregation ATPase FtsK/SpoIIIE
MRVLQPTETPRFNEPVGFIVLSVAIALGLSLVSYQPFDPSSNVAGAMEAPGNLIGFPGAYASDILLQWLGLGAFLLPLYLAALGWSWVRSTPLPTPRGRAAGALLLLLVVCTGLSLPAVTAWRGTIKYGGVIGSLTSEVLVFYLNEAGFLLVLAAAAVVSLYLVTQFELRGSTSWTQKLSRRFGSVTGRWKAWLVSRRTSASKQSGGSRERRRFRIESRTGVNAEPGSAEAERAIAPFAMDTEAGTFEPPPIIPYETVPDLASSGKAKAFLEPEDPFTTSEPGAPIPRERPKTYRMPSTLLLHTPDPRSAYDPDELHDIARLICQKFDEFGVGGSVSQINPGPVVTTFEFKPNPGIKYTRIVNLSEDLCLALECESIMVERIPGKSTVGIEIPNRKREVISLREVIESPEFSDAESLLTMALGKDINGRIKCADLASMPHVLVAGSTGAGKSVLINSIVMSILYKATPEQVRFIMVDPKTVELGLYIDIPHLLTPVITDMKKAANALKNATREMERRLKLLAEFGVRNLDQYNRKVSKLTSKAAGTASEEGEPPCKLPYIVIIIDELADLMMVEGRQIEEAITRLAQMARAVGIHLILATQRPSVDVITGLIKANIPSRISFRLATRVDSRTILDSMGAESLLGRGDMLFLPPASSRLQRLHGPFVAEEEIEAVVNAWKSQDKPDYEDQFLAPPAEEGDADDDDADFDDPAYEDAIRVVLEMGKASTSILQRRLRLGYGRAARILDVMEREGIIGPPDGSRPREVLKSPDWQNVEG